MMTDYALHTHQRDPIDDLSLRPHRRPAPARAPINDLLPESLTR
jgi:hypothetical protein